jgi:hypothetical protein
VVFRFSLKGTERPTDAPDQQPPQRKCAASGDGQPTSALGEKRKRPRLIESRTPVRTALPRSLLNSNLVFFANFVNGSCVLHGGTEVTCV